MKIALITDTHFGARGDAPWMHKYQKQFYENIFFPKLKQEGIKTVLHGGDLFDDRKSINVLTIRKTKNMFLNQLEKHNMKMYIIPGNHDVFYKNMNDVSSVNELLESYPNISIITEPTSLMLGTKNISMIPWINNSNYDEIMKYIRKDTSHILYGHFELAGFEMHSGIINEHGMDHKLFSKYERVWSGHFHQPSSQDNVKYLGSPFEMSWADYSQPRGFYLYDTVNDDLEFIRNPYALFEKIFYDEDQIDINSFDYDKYSSKFVQIYVQNKTDISKFDKFVDSMVKIDTINLVIYDTSININNTIQPMNLVSQSTRDLMRDYVDNIADPNLEKDEIKKILDNLYIEASVL